MADLEPSKQNIYAKTDWNSYMRYRPAYPDSLIRLILSHHRDNSNQLRLAYDIGAGNGIFASHLAPYFNHIHVADPDAENVNEARTMLASDAHAAKDRPATFSFSVNSAESAQKVVLPNSVDLVSMATCAHWTDIDSTVQAVSQVLKHGGTFAVVYYHAIPLVVDGPGEIGQRLEQLMQRAASVALAQLKHDGKVSVVRGFHQGSIGNDFIPLPADLFETRLTKRINLNVFGNASSAFTFTGNDADQALSQVREGEALLEYNQPDKEAIGWEFKIGPGWLRGLLMTIAPARAQAEATFAELDELDKLIRQVPGEQITVRFSAALLLATRK